jgi:hypothetical protein
MNAGTCELLIPASLGSESAANACGCGQGCCVHPTIATIFSRGLIRLRDLWKFFLTTIKSFDARPGVHAALTRKNSVVDSPEFVTL